MKRRGIALIGAFAAGAVLCAGRAMAVEPALARAPSVGLNVGQGGVDVFAGQGVSLQAGGTSVSAQAGGTSVSAQAGGLSLNVGTPAERIERAAAPAVTARGVQGVTLNAGDSVALGVGGGAVLLRAGRAAIGIGSPGMRSSRGSARGLAGIGRR